MKSHPNESADPAAQALGQLYEQFTNVQNLAEFHAALRKRDALYDAQHREMSDNPADYENLHPKDFFDQFHRRADEDDKSVVSEAPYRIRQKLRDALRAERDTAKSRALETYKKLFIGHHLAQLDRDRLYYLGKVADAASDQDRERYLTALVGRLQLSGIGKLPARNRPAARKLCVTLRHTATFATKIFLTNIRFRFNIPDKIETVRTAARAHRSAAPFKSSL